jgi:hypothetical protein
MSSWTFWICKERELMLQIWVCKSHGNHRNCSFLFGFSDMDLDFEREM